MLTAWQEHRPAALAPALMHQVSWLHTLLARMGKLAADCWQLLLLADLHQDPYHCYAAHQAYDCCQKGFQQQGDPLLQSIGCVRLA